MMKIMLKYNPQNEIAVNPVSELATPHAFTVFRELLTRLQFRLPFPTVQELLQVAFQFRVSAIFQFHCQTDFSPTNCEAASSGRTSTYPFVPAI